MKVIVFAAFGVLIGIGGLVNGVTVGWIFIIIGALVLIAQGFQYQKRAKKANNNIPICSADDIKATIYLDDEHVRIYCDYDRTASQYKKVVC